MCLQRGFLQDDTLCVINLQSLTLSSETSLSRQDICSLSHHNKHLLALNQAALGFLSAAGMLQSNFFLFHGPNEFKFGLMETLNCLYVQTSLLMADYDQGVPHQLHPSVQLKQI